MINIGEYNKLKIARKADHGLYLVDEVEESVLLPNKYCPNDYEFGQDIEVFIYLDSEERPIATNLKPKVTLHNFGFLKVNDVNKVGAFLDWGLEKDLFVPFKEQPVNMEKGRWYLVYLDFDEQTARLYASNRIERYIQNIHINVEEGQEVDLIVWKKVDLGYNVIVEEEHLGLLYNNEIFKKINVGDKIKGYVKKVREDNKLDISLNPIGYTNFNDKNCDLILSKLKENDGFLGLNDKSTPDEISEILGISKKAFKKALGALYKFKQVDILDNEIKLLTIK